MTGTNNKMFFENVPRPNCICVMCIICRYNIVFDLNNIGDIVKSQISIPLYYRVQSEQSLRLLYDYSNIMFIKSFGVDDENGRKARS